LRRLAPLAAGIVAAGAAVVGADPLVVRPEPGVALPGGGALLPFVVADSSGAVFPVHAGEMVLEAADGATLRGELVSFGGPGAEPFALHVLVDAKSLRGADVTAWSAELSGFLRDDGGPGTRAAHVVASRLESLRPGDGPPTAEDVRKRIASAGDGALWDRTLEALDLLSGPGPPARRLLLLVADGEEGRESRHPAQTCADAADTARVCVWILVPASATPAARARLEALAARTGGGCTEAGARGASALPATLARIRAAQALRVASLPAPPPVQVSLRPGVATAAPAAAWIRTRRALDLTPRPFPWLPLVAALVVAVGAGAIVVVRHLPVGRVRGAPGTDGAVPVTRAGLTIGAAVGNGLVVGHPRISRHHAVIRLEKGRIVLVDLRSSNGTKVNGRRVTTAPLRDGDRILLAEAVEMIWEEGFRFGKGG